MKVLVSCFVLAGLSLSCCGADLRTDRPRLLSAETIARLRQQAQHGNSAFHPVKELVDRTSGGALARVHNAALTAVVDPQYCEVTSKAAVDTVKWFATRFIIVAATNTNPTVLTFDRPHGWEPGKDVTRVALSFFTDKWSNLGGTRKITAVDETRVSVAWDGTKADEYRGGAQAFATVKSYQDFGLNSVREQWWRVALAYDVCRDRMPAADAEVVRDYLRAVLEYTVHTSNLADTYDKPAENLLGNLGAGRLMGILKIAAALHGDVNVDQEWKYARGLVDDLLQVLNKGAGKGGALTEGAEYAPHAYWYIIESLDVVEAATGDEVWKAVPDWLTEVLNYNIHATSPVPGGSTKSFQPMPFGDNQSPEQYTWSYRRFMLALKSHLLARGATAEAAKAASWLESIKPSYLSSSTRNFGEFWFYDFLYDVPQVNADGFRPESPTYFAQGMGQVLMRSGGTWASFNCGPQGFIHVHPDCGQFQIWRNGKWLTKERTGYSHAVPVNHNVLLMNGRGSYFWLNGGTPRAQGSISQFFESPEYVYAQADMSGTYAHRGATRIVETAVRDFYYIAPDTWIIKDFARFNSKDPKLASFIVNSDFEPTVQGNRVILQADDGQRLYVDVVTPTNPRIFVRPHAFRYLTAVEQAKKPLLMTSAVSQSTTLNVEGATGQWSMLNGSHKVHKNSSDSMAFVGTELDTSGITEPFVGQNAIIGKNSGSSATGFWTEITSGVPSDSHEHVVVIRATDGNDPGPVPTVPIRGDSAYGVALRGHVFAFLSGKSGRYTFPVGSVRDSVTHIIAGLDRSTEYACQVEQGQVTVGPGTGCRSNSAGQIVLKTRGATVAQLPQNAQAPQTQTRSRTR